MMARYLAHLRAIQPLIGYVISISKSIIPARCLSESKGARRSRSPCNQSARTSIACCLAQSVSDCRVSSLNPVPILQTD